MLLKENHLMSMPLLKIMELLIDKVLLVCVLRIGTKLMTLIMMLRRVGVQTACITILLIYLRCMESSRARSSAYLLVKR